MAGADGGGALPRVVRPLSGVPVVALALVFSIEVEPGAACVVLPCPAGWDLSLPPSTAAFSGGGGVVGWGVLPVVVLGKGLAVATAGLGLAMAGRAERPPLGARRGRSAGGLVSGASVPWAGGSDDGPAVTTAWLGAGPTALAPGFSSVATFRDVIPTALPAVLRSGWGSPEAPIADGGVARDSGDMPAAISWGMLDGDTPRAIPAVALPSRRGGVPACNAMGMLASLCSPGMPGTVVPTAGAGLGDHVAAP